MAASLPSRCTPEECRPLKTQLGILGVLASYAPSMWQTRMPVEVPVRPKQKLMLPAGSLGREPRSQSVDDDASPQAPRSYWYRRSCEPRSPSVDSADSRSSSPSLKDRLEMDTFIEPFSGSPRAAHNTYDSECAICMESFIVGELLRTLPCKHRFHAECVDQWFSTTSNITCPICRE
mmetsp:Transcript_87389/g.154984  ORF Transcript_87389/g.154984 Transcript_87389/m.154984 type:complete len:177 (+) Transcript_87389:51-581(+)